MMKVKGIGLHIKYNFIPESGGLSNFLKCNIHNAADALGIHKLYDEVCHKDICCKSYYYFACGHWDV